MIVIVCGQKNSGKSVGLEILQESKYHIFHTDQWIHSIYQVNNIGYENIKTKLGEEFVNEKEVDRKKIRAWIKAVHVEGSQNNPNLMKLNTVTLPLIKSKLIELRNKGGLIFVELAILPNHIAFFSDVYDEAIYIRRNKQNTYESGSPEFYLKDVIDPKWHVVENYTSISDYKKKLIATVDNLIKGKLKVVYHIDTNRVK